MKDLKQITYVDAMKIILSFLNCKDNTNEGKKASQEDIDILLG